MAPPRIIMTRNADPCVVYFPSPAIAREKMQGHMIEHSIGRCKKRVNGDKTCRVERYNDGDESENPEHAERKGGFVFREEERSDLD